VIDRQREPGPTRVADERRDRERPGQLDPVRLDARRRDDDRYVRVMLA